MDLVLSTKVTSDPSDVYSSFNEELFLALVPPGTKIKQLSFGGSTTGDVVELRLSSFGVPQHWLTHITAHGEKDGGYYFIDEGQTLPFFLSSWRHQHIIRATDDGSEIVDHISFKTPWWLPVLLMWPVLYLQFAYRKPIYQRFFGKPK